MSHDHITHQTMNLEDCHNLWTFNAEYDCWCLNDILYAPKPEVPACQRLSIFAPKAFMTSDGLLTAPSKRAPVVFMNNAAGYMQMPPAPLGDDRCRARQFLERGFVYVTCGCRGRDSRSKSGEAAGKAPITLVDLKMALRFLRRSRAVLPGDWDKVISSGWSAGGAMSALLGVTGDHPDYDAYLRAAGAFMEESDAVFAAQIYCPIIDLEHADMAYEWMFCADKTCEDSHAGPSETMSPFKEAISRQLYRQYIDYVNSLFLRHPQTGEPLKLHSDGRSGALYDYLMEQIQLSARKYEKFANLSSGAAQQDVILNDLDAFVLHYRGRMKPCTCFDKLSMDSGENHLFGTNRQDYVHFSSSVHQALEAVAHQWPAETAASLSAFDADLSDPVLDQRLRLLNPMCFIGDPKAKTAKHFRIRVGACDADTSFSVSLSLALLLMQAGCTADYALVWDQPHCDADYPGECENWIEDICQ